MSADLASEVALPGAPDLDLDVSNLTITAVVAEGREILVRLTGGQGTWTETGTGEQVSGLRDVVTELRADFQADMPADLFAAFVPRLQRWRDSATFLRMCAAPGRASLLMDPASGDFVPWPRHWPPTGSD